MKLLTPEGMDKALNIKQRGCAQYSIEYDADRWYRRRMYGVMDCLREHGFRSNDIEYEDEVADGSYQIQCWLTTIPVDSEFNLEVVADGGRYLTAKLRIWKWDEEMELYGVAKEVTLVVPKAAKYDTPEGTVYIMDTTETPFPLEVWTPEQFVKLTVYECTLPLLPQTLEVVFDITPGGYIPLRPAARETAMVMTYEEE